MEVAVVEVCKLTGPWGIVAITVGSALSLSIRSYTRIKLAKILTAAGGGTLTDNRLSGMIMHIDKTAEHRIPGSSRDTILRSISRPRGDLN